ncbi:MATE family efflux transporter [Lutibacter citreus]|uniref:MATE family efflux transporter n=1 Tax=Lutibacter citreus TaxID=2138210 RepID=UPI000DBE39D4|nr:MATE family efflux transporter [Lutibacter citreus]
MYKASNITFKGINKLAIPAIISGIAEPLLSITDTAIVGNININPTEALAAVGIAGSFISALVWILAQTRSAISATISKYLGARKLNEIGTLPAQIIAINLVLSIVIYLVTLLFVNQIFKLYNAEGIILNYAVAYYKIRAIGFPLTLFVFSAFGVFRGLQNTYWPMVISIIGAVLNVVLDVALVYGIEGFIDPLNVEGAAWASVISQGVMAILAAVLLFKKTPFSYKLKFPFNKEIKNLIAISLNLIVRAVALNIALYLSNSYATKYGDNYIAAQTIAFQIWLFFSFFIDGYASVGNIVSGKLLGEKDYKSLWILSVKLSRYSIIIALILACLCGVFYNDIGKLFSKDTNVLASFYQIFWIVILMQPINAVAFVFDGIFKGLAEAVILRNLLIVATFLGFIPALVIGDYFDLKLYAIWIAFTIWMLLRSGILVVKFRNKYLHKNT